MSLPRKNGVHKKIRKTASKRKKKERDGKLRA
jgi:hypothetical protein